MTESWGGSINCMGELGWTENLALIESCMEEVGVKKLGW